MTFPAATRCLAPTAIVVALTMLLTGCSEGAASGDAVAGTTTTTTPPKPLPPVASVTDGQKDYNPNTPVSVKAVQGDLDAVTMTNQDGKVVKAKMSADKKSWTTDEDLGYYKTYTIKASSTDGESTTLSFDTIKPTAVTNVSLTPIPTSTVGVGQTIQFHFGHAIPDREAAQKLIKITTDPPVEGAFFWLSNTELRWRPENYWQPGTKVNVDVKLYGADLGDGIYGGADNSTSFTIGDKVVAVADDNTKMITVSKNGQVVKTMPTSMGQPKYPTPTGVYTIGDQYPSIIMDSSTFGVPVNTADGYRSNVLWATQMSYSGIFVHAAPWSLWAQGSQDVSHGCLNVSTANAKWFQEFVKRGDLVIVKNTAGGPLNGYDGLGDWNIPWETWKAGNAKGNKN